MTNATWKDIKDGFEAEIKGCLIRYWPLENSATVIIPDENAYLILYIRLPIVDGFNDMYAHFSEETKDEFHAGPDWNTEILLTLMPDPVEIDCTTDENDQIWFAGIETFMMHCDIENIKEWMREDGF